MFKRIVQCWDEWIHGIEYAVDVVGLNWSIINKNTGRKEAGGKCDTFDEALSAARRWVASAHCNIR